jgi:hypothetical protein
MSQFQIILFVGLLGTCFGILPPNYEHLSANEKLDILWRQISQEPYSDNSLPTTKPATIASLFLPPYLEKSFTVTSDEMPVGRTKLIHTYGSVAKVELRITNNSSRFTGIFKSGGVGLARLSLGVSDDTKFFPGLALKILVDQKPSRNFHAIRAQGSQGSDRNFFAGTLTNILDEPTSFSEMILGKAFALTLWLLPGGNEDRPESNLNLPLYEQAAVDCHGEIPTSVYAPYVIKFLPNPSLAWSPNTNNDFRVNLKGVPTGSLLYTVSVGRDLLSNEQVIGELVTTSPLVASKYGDENLFFQHAHKRWRP